MNREFLAPAVAVTPLALAPVTFAWSLSPIRTLTPIAFSQLFTFSSIIRPLFVLGHEILPAHRAS